MKATPTPKRPVKVTLSKMLEGDAAGVFNVPTAVHRRRTWLRMRLQ
jgi:hypothetical protein